MTNAIDDPPLVYDFGTEFNYSTWTQDTTLTLVNVPWNNDYRDIVKFDSPEELNTYINSIEGAGVRIDNLSYVKANQPIRINLPFNSVYKYNYLRAVNIVQPIPGDVNKQFYYFITDVRYIAPNTTEIVVQLDVWQTFNFDLTFGNSYIERGHIGIANENAFDNYGRDYLTIPEGIDVGSEMQIVTKRTEKIMQLDGETGSSSRNNTILVASTVDLEADPGDVTDPMLESAPGSFFSLVPSGAAYYVWQGGTNFFAFMNDMKDKPWITQGIISITIIPDINRYLSYELEHDNVEPTPAPWSRIYNLKHEMFEDWRNSEEILEYIPERYRHLKKLWTSPYMAIELTTFTGTPILIKPESWADDNASVIERPALIPPNQRITFYPFKYNAIAGSDTDPAHPIVPDGNPNYGGDDNGEFVDFATQISNFPTLAIVNNGAIGYMASNMNTIAFQQSSAGWQQTRALRSNEVSYDQATSGMNLANDLTQQGVNADTVQTGIANQQAGLQALAGGATSIAGGAAAGGMRGGVGGAAVGGVGGLAGAAGGMLSAGIAVSGNQLSLAARNTAAYLANRSRVGNQGFIRDTNKNLADWAARGDYENNIAGINAKVQDAQLIQPTTSGQVGGEMMNLLHNNFAISARWKMIDRASIRVIGEYWLRYGYAVRQFAIMPTTLKVMTKFSYWKLSETYVAAANMPETFKQAIRGIFEKGVTVWSDPAYIGNTDIGDNQPLEGITL